ncbi:MAG: hypothetical protein ACEY3M_03670 [Wolbachia sp.]
MTLAYLAKSLELIIDKKAISNVVQMTEVKGIIDALQKRLKDLAANSTPDQLAYLAKALESIVDKSAVSEIVQMTDGKLKELLNAARSHVNEINSNKENSISVITEAKTDSLAEINILKTESLNALKTSSDSHISLLDTRKNTNIAAINSIGEEKVSSLISLSKNHLKIEDNAAALLFTIFNYTSKKTRSSRSVIMRLYMPSANDMLGFLTTGSDTYKFYHPPQLYFLRGNEGKFVYQEGFLSVVDAEHSQNFYPYTLLGGMFIKNTTSQDISRTLDFSGSSLWQLYPPFLDTILEARLFVGTPNNVNTKEVSSITWNEVYSCERNSEFSDSATINIPANKTVVILFYTSAYLSSFTPFYNGYSFFMEWSIHNFRNNFLTAGLEVDMERTLKAWQCPGLDATHKIWN